MILDPVARYGADFYAQATATVARALVGATLVALDEAGGVVAGRIVETEAYLGPEDAASHAAFLARGRVGLAMPPGSVYVCRAYGIHLMFNVVTEPAGQHGAVLVRALEPLAGIDAMVARRGVADPLRLARGPGCVAQALGITLADHGRNLAADPRRWIQPGPPPATLLVSPRVGIIRNADALLRFFDGDSRAVSATRRGVVAS